MFGSLVRVRADNDTIVCGVHKIGRYSPHFDDSTVEANAHLIAAAPDLLSACENVLPMLERALAMIQPLRAGHATIETPDEKIGRMRAAVAKAKGCRDIS